MNNLSISFIWWLDPRKYANTVLQQTPFNFRQIIMTGQMIIFQGGSNWPCSIERAKRYIRAIFLLIQELWGLPFLCDYLKENAFTALSYLEEICRTCKADTQNSHITKTHVFSDGTSCFTLLSLEGTEQNACVLVLSIGFTRAIYLLQISESRKGIFLGVVTQSITQKRESSKLLYM